MQKHCIRVKVKKKEQRKGANKLTKSVKKSTAAQDEHALFIFTDWILQKCFENTNYEYTIEYT